MSRTGDPSRRLTGCQWLGERLRSKGVYPPRNVRICSIGNFEGLAVYIQAWSVSYLEDDPSHIPFFRDLHASHRNLPSRLQLRFVQLGQRILKVSTSQQTQHQKNLVPCPTSSTGALLCHYYP
jgi:hypothetical protein